MKELSRGGQSDTSPLNYFSSCEPQIRYSKKYMGNFMHELHFFFHSKIHIEEKKVFAPLGKVKQGILLIWLFSRYSDLVKSLF